MRLILVNVVFLLLNYGQCYKILGLFPYPARSHYTVFDSLMVALAARGHEVTVYNTFPKDTRLPNYKEVSIKECFSLPNVLVTMEQMRVMDGALPLKVGFENFLPRKEHIFNCKPLKALLNTTEQSYDVLVTETFLSDFFQLFGDRLQIPVITFHTNTPLPWMSDQTGLPHNPSYIPHPYEAFPAKMTFVQRLLNTAYYLHSFFLYKFMSETQSDQMGREFFGPSTRPLGEVVKNTSMLFLYTHYSLNGARPIVPNVVEVAGCNIKPPKALPKDIQKFIDESTHGVVYFCMGSLLRGEAFSEDKRKAFLSAFSKIPQRVLWKWEGDELPGKTDNIMISKWMPQRDILAHPNVKLFISHGGLLGTTEAVYEGVPVLGIPIFGDQRSNVKALETNGAGEVLDFEDITKEVVLENIQRIVNNPEYKQKAKELSDRYRDRPMAPLDTAVYWTEYVIRHRGAHHLKTAAVNMPWYQYLLLDVIALLLFAFVSITAILYYSIKLTLSFIFNLLCGKKSAKPSKKAKRN